MAFNESAIVAELNRKRFHDLILVFVYMVVLATVGVIGNTLVIFVYRTRFAKCTSSYFIIGLAVLDLLTCAVGMPFDIVDMTFWYGFRFPVTCKLLRFVTYFTVMTSGVILIMVAFDRYYKVCRPLKRFPVTMTKILIGIAVLIGLAFSWPALVIFGNRDIYIPEYNLTTVQCSAETRLIGTIYPMLYYAVLGGAFVLCTAFLIVLYSCLLGQLRKRNRRISRAFGRPSSYMPRPQSSSQESSASFEADGREQDAPGTKRKSPFKRHTSTNVNKMTSTAASENKTINLERMNAIFLAISCVFVLTYLPCLIVIILRSTIVDFENFSSLAADIASQLFIRSYFINNAVNPIIYGFLNRRFRKECCKIFVKLYKKCYCRCTNKRQAVDAGRTDSPGD